MEVQKDAKVDLLQLHWNASISPVGRCCHLIAAKPWKLGVFVAFSTDQKSIHCPRKLCPKVDCHT